MAATRSCWEPLGLFLLLFLGNSEAMLQKLVVQKPDGFFLRSEKTFVLKCPLIGSGVPRHRRSPFLFHHEMSRMRIISDITMDFRINWSLQERGYYVWYTGRNPVGYKVGTCTHIPEDATTKTRVEAKSPSSIQQYGGLVSVNCRLQGSYPSETRLVWLKNGKEIEQGQANLMPRNIDTNLKEARPMQEDRFTCQVVHPAQPPLNASLVLKFRMEPHGMIDPGSSEKGHWQWHNSVLWLGLLLNKTITAIVLLCLILRQLGQPLQDLQLLMPESG